MGAIDDAMYVIGGKWKMHLITALYFGEKRYSELLETIDGISGKMLSRVLKEMEINLLIKRDVINTRPVTVTYELTEYAKELFPVIDMLANWGTRHKNQIKSQ